MKNQMRCLSMVLFILTVHTTRAATLTFDDVPRGTNVGNHYAALGVHFDPTDFGVQEGLVNGDSGNWGLDGTSGPFFDGFNGLSPSTYSMILTFDMPVTLFSLDASRSNGSVPGDTLTVSGFLGAVLIDSRTITFGAINNWTSVTLAGTFDSVQWSGSGIDFHPYGIDNINFTPVPEPSTLWLILGAGLVFLGRGKLFRANAA